MTSPRHDVRVTDRPGEALKRADNKAEARERRYVTARAHQKAQAAREADEARRDRELQRTLRAECEARNPGWFS